MSKAQGRRVSVKDVQMVQRFIEKCLNLYMTRREAVNKLFHSEEIEPVFTEIVWQRLEAENKEFFKAYSIRVIVKGQILRFNELLKRQVDLMKLMYIDGYSMQGNSASRYPQPHLSCIDCDNGDPQLANMSLAQNSNVGMVQGFNNGVMFGANYNLLEPHTVMTEVSLSPFNGGGLLKTNMNSFGEEHMTQDFSLSDISTGISHTTDILGSYFTSPLMGTNPNLLDPHMTAEAEIRMLKAKTDDFTYQ